MKQSMRNRKLIPFEVIEKAVAGERRIEALHGIYQISVLHKVV